MRILCLDGRESDLHYKCLRQETPDWEWLYFDEIDVDLTFKSYDIGLITDEFWDVSALRVRSAANASLPTLHLIDGIIEWRNTWDNPRSKLNGMPLFQPILCHKVACLGRSQVRILESWGNLGICEVVGAPRFDSIIRSHRRNVSESFEVLVITARTPAFTERHLTATIQSLHDLKQWLGLNRVFNGREIKVKWRIGDRLAESIGLQPEEIDFMAGDLRDSLALSDAVITTPSTSMLEAMLVGLPVALLDYHQCPQYVPAGWSISTASHIEQAILGLMERPLDRMLFQDFTLHDALECRTPATPRMIRLITEMAKIGHECRRANRPLSFPDEILPPRMGVHHEPEVKFDLQALYPGHPVFGFKDLVSLQVELGHCRSEILRLERVIANETDDSSSFTFLNLGLRKLGSLVTKIARMLARLASAPTAFFI